MRNRQLHDRLARLEARLLDSPIVLLTMADGTQHSVIFTTKHFFDLHEYVCMCVNRSVKPEERDEKLDRERQLFRNAVSVIGPEGCGMLPSMIRSLSQYDYNPEVVDD